MKVLVIGNDPSLWNGNSEAFQRVREYSGLFKEYHVVLMAGGDKPRSFGNLHLYPVYSRIPFFRAFAAARVARQIARGRKIDIIDAQDPSEAGLAAWLVAQKTGIPFRVQIHTDIFSPFYRRAGWKEYIRYLLARFIIPRASCVRAVSERIKNSLLQATSHKLQAINILPIFTDIEKFLSAPPAPRPAGNAFRMVAVGRFVDKEKNFSMLIDMMRDFVGEAPDATLTLVGDGPDRKNYESRIRNQELEKYVKIASWREDLPSYLSSFDLYLLSSNYEGWGRTVVEAMAAGLPVIMTDVGLAGEFVKNDENGLVVPVGDKEAFLGAVKELYKDKEKRRGVAQAALGTVKNLKPRTKEEYLRKYRELLEVCVRK